jgi:protease I
MGQNRLGKDYKVDQVLNTVKASDYDALILPGGVINPDILRTNKDAFLLDFFKAGKPVAAICRPQILISAGLVNGRKMTSYPSIKLI